MTDALRKLPEDVLGEILRLHELWVNGDASGVRANLSRADLSRADLSGADLTGADLSRADLSGADLTGADLEGANLRGVDLTAANLTSVNLKWADLSRGNLSCVDLSGVNLEGVNLEGADLTGADLTGADLTAANLSDANLSRANLSRANLSGAHLSGAHLPAPTMMLLADWGALPDTLCASAMAYDASCHPDPSAFVRWAVRHNGPCPYKGVKFNRACQFDESRSAFDPAVPAPRAWDLMVELIKTKCKASDFHDEQS